jgi:hypothetical protein
MSYRVEILRSSSAICRWSSENHSDHWQDSKTNNWEFYVCGGNLPTVLVDVLDPGVMIFEAVGGNPNDLNISVFEVRGSASDFPELGGTDRSEVTRMREQHSLDIS